MLIHFMASKDRNILFNTGENSNGMSRAKLFVLAFILSALVLDFGAPLAFAGILVPSSTVSSSYNYRPRSKFRTSRVHWSTWALRKTNPSMPRKSQWSSSDELKRIQAYTKYQQRLYNWEKKRQKDLQNRIRKAERQQAYLEKKLKKQEERARINEQSEQKPAVEERKTPRIDLFGRDKSEAEIPETQKTPKSSFWNRLKKTLFG